MKISRRDLASGVAVLHLEGRLNAVSTDALRKAVHDVVNGGTSQIAIDLSDVGFVDSSGLGALVSGLKETRRAGGDLRIAAANDQVRLVLQLTNLDRVLKPYMTVEDAYASS